MFESFHQVPEDRQRLSDHHPSFETREHAEAWVMADWHTCASEVEDCRGYFEDYWM